MKKKNIKKIILSVTIPLIFLLSEVFFLLLSKNTLRFEKPWFFLTLIFILSLTPFIFRWEVKLISDLLLYLMMVVIVISNMHYLIKSGSSNVNIYNFDNTPYFINNSSSLNISVMVVIGIVGLTGVTLLNFFFRDKQIFIIERSLNAIRINIYKTPVFILTSIIILTICYHLQVTNNNDYHDFKTFVKSTSVANNQGSFTYGIYNLMNQSAKKRNINHLLRLSIEQRDDKGNLIPIESQEHLLYSSQPQNSPRKQNYLIINLPGFTFEPLNEINTNKSLTPFFKTLDEVITVSNVYSNFLNINPSFISEQQLFLGHIPSLPYFNSHLDVELRYSMPMLLQRNNYDTFYLTKNDMTVYNYNKIYHYLGYTNFLSNSHITDDEIQKITKKITTLKEQLAIASQVIDKERIQKEIVSLEEKQKLLLSITGEKNIKQINNTTLPQIIDVINTFSKNNTKNFLINITLDVLQNFHTDDDNYKLFAENLKKVLPSLPNAGINYYYGLHTLSNFLESITNNTNINPLTVILAGAPYDYYQEKINDFLNRFNANSNEEIVSDKFGKYCLVYFQKGTPLDGIRKTIKQITTPYMIAPEILKNEAVAYPAKLYLAGPISNKTPKLQDTFLFSKFSHIYGYNGYWLVGRKALSVDSSHLPALDEAARTQYLIDSYFAYGINMAESGK